MAIPKPNIATAAKAKTTSAAVNAKVLAAAAKESPLINPNQVHNQGTDGSSQVKKPRPGFEGPSPNIPDVSKPGGDSYTSKTAADQQATIDQALGVVSQGHVLDALAGKGASTPAASAATTAVNAVLAGSNKTDKPATDQGFGSKPSTIGFDPVTGLNPMAAYQGQAIGGVLGAVAGKDVKVPPTSSGAAGSGMVSAEPAKDADKKDVNPGPGSAANATTNKDGEVSEKNPTTPIKEDSFWQKLVKIFTGQTNIDGTKTERQKQLDQTLLEMPNPENTGSNVNILTQTLLDQLNAAQTGKPTSQGGSGDVTPVDDGGLPQVVNNGSIAVNQGVIDSRNMFGNPGGPGGENVSGGNKGLGGFTNSNGAGAINPGPDGGNPSGDSRFQQDPAAAMGGNQPAPEFPAQGGGQESQSSSVTTTLAAGIRNLSLTGAAAINGTGNALDNLITGNGAANELRGGAGNDTLDGKAGNDLLDGGSGRDVLTGGSGADRFRFSSAGSFGTTQADRITDFSRSDGDRIEISRTAFGITAGAPLSFQAVNSDADLIRALGSSTLLIQDMHDGSLLFNQNGASAGAGLGGVFGQVGNGLTLQASDFSLLA